MGILLSQEQQSFIELAQKGYNILVDACIGSGKTTSIQGLCDTLDNHRSILYLTYNRLLKLDARAKIKNKNVTVTNYHGLAYQYIKSTPYHAGVADSIKAFCRAKPKIKWYDTLIIDEYQDIEQELAEMLVYIKSTNPHMQIIAVGDMSQKIYDKTTLDVGKFIHEFLGEYRRREFTQCFRLPSDFASMLGRVWQKSIVGVNNDCNIDYMPMQEVVKFLSQCETGDILCLGSRTGTMADTLNTLEQDYANKYNKYTVYASIAENDAVRKVEPNSSSAIFTTFDSSKGLERPICVVFNFEEDYWDTRIKKPQQSYEILRNIFCVAASRGKKRIIFVTTDDSELAKKRILSEKTLSTKVGSKYNFEPFNISTMFDFRYKEDIFACRELLAINPIGDTDTAEITIDNIDGLIDLSPCIGIYQEAVFFDNYNIDTAIRLALTLSNQKYLLKDKTYMSSIEQLELEDKILYLVSIETRQDRYRKQARRKFVDQNQKQIIIDRLSKVFVTGERVQIPSTILFADYTNNNQRLEIAGLCDCIKDNIVYELKFVNEVSAEHFLQLACYMMAQNIQTGILWNIRKNEKYQVQIKSPTTFLDSVIKTITKGYLTKYIQPFDNQKAESYDTNSSDNSIKSLNQFYNSNDHSTVFRPIIKHQLQKRDASQFQVGQKVHHPKFGNGIILQCKQSPSTTLAIINFFDGIGNKTLDLTLAPLEIQSQ